MKKIKKSLKTLIASSILASGIILSSCVSKSSTTMYKINVEANGGSNVGESYELESGGNYSLPTPTRDGYSFDGWYLNSDFSGDVVTSINSINGDVTVYAKWTKLYVVNMVGADVSSFNTKAGVVLADALKDYTPKNDLIFAGWYLNNSKLADDYVMPEADITVEAKFMQSYKDEYYYQSLDGTTYSLGETKTGNEMIGETHISNDIVTGYDEVENSNTIKSVVIDKDGNKNITRRYFNRKELSISFNTNYPTDKENDIVKVTAKTGEEVAMPTDIDCDGYALVGYSKEKNGEVVIPYNYLEANLYGENNTVKDTFIASEETTYYAVWAKGYVDMFGGVDQIFIASETSKDVYIKRNGIVFKGKYQKNSKTFTIVDTLDEILITGKINEDYTFSYENTNRASLEYTMFVPGSGVDSSTKMLFDKYNGIEIVTTVGALQTRKKGEFIINEDYTFTATLKDEAGQTEVINFQLGTYNNQRVFQLENKEEKELGDLYLFRVEGASLIMDSAQKLTLNGYSNAKFGSSSYFYKYNSENQTITLYNSSTGRVAYELEIKEIDNQIGVLIYDSTTDHEYHNNDDVLTTDGLGNAKYVAGTDEFSGYYTTTSSQFGSTILTVSNDYGDSFKFMLIENKEDVIDPETLEVISSNTTYSFKLLNDNYKEYIYQADDGAYYAPLLVIEDETHATLYGFVARGVFQKISTGTYSLLDGKTTYTATEYFDIPADVTVQNSTIISTEEKVDLTTIKSFIFKTVALNSTVYATYWYGYVLKDDTAIFLSTKYTGIYETYDSDGSPLNVDLEIEFVANKAVVTVLSNGNVLDCAFTTSDGITTITYNSQIFMYIELKDDNTFSVVSLPYKANNIEDGNTDSSKYFMVDKDGNYVYYEVIKTEDDPSTDEDESKTETKEYKGSVTSTGKTNPAGFEIFKFKSDDNLVEFEFIELQNGSNHFFAKKNDKYNKTFYNTEQGITITLDGYGLYAVLAIGENSAKFTFTLTDDSITINMNNNAYTFDIDGEELKIRGGEAGSWLIYENNGFDGYFLDLDGYDKAQIYTMEYNSETDKYDTVYIDENATYEMDDESGDVVLTYNVGNQTYTLYGRLMYQTISSTKYKTFTVLNEVVTTKFVNKSDYSILEIDEYSNATITKLNGTVESGKYTLITDNMIYYYNNSNTDACIYKINNETGTMEMCKYESRGYYTSNFESLLFTEYGFAIFDNEERYYYDIDENDNVTIYKRDVLNENANEYGFVATNFGSVSDEEADLQKTYEGKVYYINKGFSLQFNRQEDNKDIYPIISKGVTYNIKKLYFAPSDDEFSISCLIELSYLDNGEEKTGNVQGKITRKKVDDDKYEMYITYNYINIYIEAEYKGNDDEGNSLSTYKITKMDRVIEFKSATFYQMVNLYYQFTRQDMRDKEDTYGGVKIVTTYNEDGTTNSDLITSYFGDSTTYKDMNGELLNFVDAEYKSSSSLIVVDVLASDGFTYRLYLEVSSMTVIDSSELAVNVAVITRLIPFDNGTISGVIEQYVNINSYDTIEKNSSIGTYASLSINDDGPVAIFTGYNGKKYVVFAEYNIITPDDPATEENEEVKETIYHYYTIDVDYDTIQEEDEKGNITNKPKEYKTVNVTEFNYSTYETDDKQSRVILTNDNELVAIYLNNELVSSENITKEEDYYLVKVKVGNSTVTYKVTLKDGKAIFEFI